MTLRKSIIGTLALAIGLSAGAFAQDQYRQRDRARNDAAYNQRYSRDGDDAWNNNYRDRDDRERDRDRDRRDRDDAYSRDRHNRDRDNRRGDRDDGYRGSYDRDGH